MNQLSKTLPLCLFCLCSVAQALHIPIQARDAPKPSASNATSGAKGLEFTSVDGLTYTGTIFVQNQAYSVVLDTSSSDLWINTSTTNPSEMTSTGVSGSSSYQDATGYGSGQGPISLAGVTVESYTVQNQALIAMNDSSGTLPDEVQGILGLGSPFNGNIASQLSSSQFSSWPFLKNLWDNIQNAQPYFTFLFTRSETGSTSGGNFTISEILSGWDGIMDSPHIPVASNYSWAVYMDGLYMGTNWISGNSVATPSSTTLSNPQSGQTLAQLATGTTLISAPKHYVDKMFSDIKGATFDCKQNMYQVPCNTQLNITLVFGGQPYPINPLDALYLGIDSDTSMMACYAAFQYSQSYQYDFVIGQTFFRNVYSLWDYGNWTSAGTGLPYVQFLSLTNQDQAMSDFSNLNGQRQHAFQIANHMIQFPWGAVVAGIFLLIAAVTALVKCVQGRRRGYMALPTS